jgi:hypothetical protein
MMKGLLLHPAPGSFNYSETLVDGEKRLGKYRLHAVPLSSKKTFQAILVVFAATSLGIAVKHQ